jgi:choline dehydrogenase
MAFRANAGINRYSGELRSPSITLPGLSRQGVVARAEAREVILSAGAVASLHILQLSGVGDPEHLRRIRLPVVHELRGGGRNMRDHYVARVSYPWSAPRPPRALARPALGPASRALALHGKGTLTYSPSIVAASVKALEESAPPDSPRPTPTRGQS